jgi:hypothetical protein
MYGSDNITSKRLRLFKDGKLITSPGNLLLFDGGVYVSG